MDGREILPILPKLIEKGNLINKTYFCLVILEIRISKRHNIVIGFSVYLHLYFVSKYPKIDFPLGRKEQIVTTITSLYFTICMFYITTLMFGIKN